MKMGNHGKLLEAKADSGTEDLRGAFKSYKAYRERISNLKILNEHAVRELVAAHNEYRSRVVYTFEKRANSGQEGFRSSMLEELFVDLFSDLVESTLETSGDRILIGKANCYVSLSFTPHSFEDLFTHPVPSIHTKDQDFVLGCVAKISIATVDQDFDARSAREFVIPVLAIECKTYLERNMLDSCAGTARRIKGAMPYCLYVVASEYIKMDVAYPELSDIDEVFILCKASNSERLARRAADSPPHEIDPELMVDFFNLVSAHLRKIWWDPTNALKRGRVIGRP